MASTKSAKTQTETESLDPDDDDRSVTAPAARKPAALHEREVRNLSTKLIWVPLNSGKYASIPAGKTAKVIRRDIDNNTAFDKLAAQGLIAFVTPVGTPVGSKP